MDKTANHHRFERLYFTLFVSPATRESFWSLCSGVGRAFFEDTLALFACEAGTGRDRIITLVLDGAGWHTAPGLSVPEGIRLVCLPPHTPELQPTETLWIHADEPISNKQLGPLAEGDAAMVKQGVALNQNHKRVRGQAGSQWQPKRVTPT